MKSKLKSMTYFLLIFSTLLLLVGCSESSNNKGCISNCISLIEEKSSLGDIEESHSIRDYSKKIDIVIVKNSHHFNNNAHQKLEDFLESIDKLDWRIGILSTRTKASQVGHLYRFNGESVSHSRPFLSPDTNNYEDVLYDALESRDCLWWCSGYNPIKTTAKAIKIAKGKNKGFFREGADAIFVYFTAYTGYTISTGYKDSFESIIYKELGPEKVVGMYGSVLTKVNGECEDGISYDKYSRGVTYYAETFAGELTDICANDFTTSLTPLSERVGTAVRYISLKYVPSKITSLIVKPTQAFRWKQKGRVIRFLKPLQSGTTVTVKYEKAK